MTDQPDFLVHHEGPDDIHPCKTWLSAVNLANTLNAEYERWALARTQEFGKIRVRSWAAPYTLEDAKDAGVITKEHPVTDHMQEAIEAGAKALPGVPANDEELRLMQNTARATITAALPHIRAMIAEEIEDHIGRVFGGRPNSSLTTSEMIAKTSSKIAAQIAKGPQQ